MQRRAESGDPRSTNPAPCLPTEQAGTRAAPAEREPSEEHRGPSQHRRCLQTARRDAGATAACGAQDEGRRGSAAPLPPPPADKPAGAALQMAAPAGCAPLNLPHPTVGGRRGGEGPTYAVGAELSWKGDGGNGPRAGGRADFQARRSKSARPSAPAAGRGGGADTAPRRRRRLGGCSRADGAAPPLTAPPPPPPALTSSWRCLPALPALPPRLARRSPARPRGAGPRRGASGQPSPSPPEARKRTAGGEHSSARRGWRSPGMDRVSPPASACPPRGGR